MWFSWKIEPDEFESNYTPTKYKSATYLLYEIRWGTSHKTFKNFCRNDEDSHAEIVFLEYACDEIYRRPSTPCCINWFLSWTPCDECAEQIINFLEENTNVTLDIRAARVYKPNQWHNQEGLRTLGTYGEDRLWISIMKQNDYKYCWRRFVNNQGMDCFQRNIDAIRYHSNQLDSILNC